MMNEVEYEWGIGMLKVMIVEDEDIVRDDIKHLINWEEHGFEIIAEARNGGEGLKLCLERNPHIIITDIKMPVMGGLDMIKQISSYHKNKIYILLTAFGDFDFARKAIRLGIHSYVLKHELDSCLLIQELEKAKGQMAEDNTIGYLSRSEMFKRLMDSKELQAENKEAITNNQLFNWKGRTGVFMIGFDQTPSGVNFKKEFIDFVYEKLFNNMEAELADCADHEYIIVFRYPGSFSEKDDYNYAFAFAHRLQEQIALRFAHTVSIGIGPKIDNTSDIKESLKQTKEIYNLKVFQKDNCIVMTPPQLNPMNNLHDELKEKMGELRLWMQDEAFNRVEASMDDLFLRLLPALQDKLALKQCVAELTRLIERLMDSKPELGTVESSVTLSHIEQLNNVYQISAYFKMIINQVKTYPKYNKKITELLRFIHDNYQRDITLAEIADRLNVSLIYASQLFKKEVGVSFMTYITKYRIEKAKQFLESGQYKVYEVSAMVGYQTIPYFSKIFKKVTGKNPSDYTI